MRDYDSIAKSLRCCVSDSEPCEHCNCELEECTPKTIMEIAADAIEELLADVPHWISVEERLPTDEDGDPGDRCIVYTDEDTIQTLPLCKVGNGYVTHWMRIEPPQKEDAE